MTCYCLGVVTSWSFVIYYCRIESEVINQSDKSQYPLSQAVGLSYIETPWCSGTGASSQASFQKSDNPRFF